jgi:A/G-specific adenine glycosylase
MRERYHQIEKKLLAWFLAHGRHDLPWRQSFSPYEVLVSEFMLQQTTVATIIPRFQEWMQRFPTLEILAEAREESVLSAWQGLGYYARARRLHTVAKTIVKDYQGLIPKTLEPLLGLPGIGPYTAKAILAFAFDQPVEVLDTNIIRVIARLNNITHAIDSKEGRALLAEDARNMLPSNKGRLFASALMDLGAMICQARDPNCGICPLRSECQAKEPSLLPRKQSRPAITKKKEQRALYQEGNSVYLEKSCGPLWKGLWILPCCPSLQKPYEMLFSLIYPITRYRVTMEVYRPKGIIPPLLHAFKIEELNEIAIASPHRKALARIFDTDLLRRPGK